MDTFDLLDISTSGEQITIKLLQNSQSPQLFNYNVPFTKNHHNDFIQLINDSNEPKIMGAWLSKTFFYHKELLDNLFKRNNGLIIFLSKDFENLPIELAYYEEQFLSLTRTVSRSFPQLDINIEEKLKHKKMLILADPLNNLKDAYEEAELLFHHLKTYQEITLDFLSKELNPVEIINIFDNYDWIYYTGHGGYKNSEGGFFNTHSKNNFNINHVSLINHSPELVFINSCYIGKGNTNLPGSLIQSLLEKGTINVIASNSIIPEQSYFRFISEFYENLLQAKSIGKSFTEAKLTSFQNNSAEWVYFQLYGPAHYVYF